MHRLRKTYAVAVTRLLLVSVLCCLLAVTVSCRKQMDPQSQPILVLYAFNYEGELIRNQMSVDTTETLLNRAVSVGTVGGKNIVLAELGIGMTNAAMTTQKMLDYYRPKAVVLTGIAGAIDSSVHIGDITVCGEWVQHDYGYIGPTGFEPRGLPVWMPGEDSVRRIDRFEVDSVMLASALKLSHEELPVASIGDRKPRLLVGGVGVTGNVFVDSREKRLWLSNHFSAVVTDMESAAVAQVCAVNEVPYIIFRSASDLAGGSGSATAAVEIEEFFKVAADNSSSVVLKFLEKL
ncbi:MAG: 5'-methylthioadenosine/S-adenosylhomocysteine nucleosidase [Candidatus Zixiibacteriota bacterium]